MNSTERFTGKARAYDQSRPDYPTEALDCIAAQCGLMPGSVVADIGAGTGKLTRMLLARGYQVIAVEPGGDMRETLREQLGDHPALRIVAAPAEDTGLDGHSIDAITAAQAFHWFDQAACKLEFARILKPGGKVALLWNNRDKDLPLTRKHGELMLEFRVREAPKLGEARAIQAFFTGGDGEFYFRHTQVLDEAALLALSFSRSYSPSPGDPQYAGLERAVKALFAEYQRDGLVEYCYKTALLIQTVEKED